MKWLLNPWLWIIIALDILLSVNYKKWIGKAGEFWVKRELKKLPSEYLVINDVMIKTNDESTHQIDHVVVSKYLYCVSSAGSSWLYCWNDWSSCKR